MVLVTERNNRQISRPSKQVVDVAFQMFWSAMRPLRESGKLGMVAFQFPPYFISKPANLDYLAGLPERLPGASIVIEFRHPSWLPQLPILHSTQARLPHPLVARSFDKRRHDRIIFGASIEV